MENLNKKELWCAIYNVKQEIPNLTKNIKGFGYNYADRNQVIDVINPLLEKYGLLLVQDLHSDDGINNYIVTRIIHIETGQEHSFKTLINLSEHIKHAEFMANKTFRFITENAERLEILGYLPTNKNKNEGIFGKLKIPASENIYQSMGSGISYMARYAIVFFFGFKMIDDDGMGYKPTEYNFENKPATKQDNQLEIVWMSEKLFKETIQNLANNPEDENVRQEAVKVFNFYNNNFADNKKHCMRNNYKNEFIKALNL